MGASANSPNVDNYYIGKGNVYFTPDGGVERHMGNVPEFVFTPELETLEHFSSMAGTRTKDFEIILEKKGTVKITLEELTPDNVALAVLGTVDMDAVGGPEVEIFSESKIAGRIRFVGTNDYGAKMNVTLYNVQFTPQADLSLISDELGNIELEGSATPDQKLGATNGKFGIIKFTNVTAPVASDLVSITPTTGPAAGGTAITVTGTGFINASGVTFGGTAGTDFIVVSDTSITVTTPPHAAGVVSVVVLDIDGNDAGLPTGYTYT